ncbi:radical SAM protein [Listeria welshimeri]|uniref:Radical SAM protein n=1 Tax=Listeria welshimeri TaxID=1643 RepID=A0A7X0T7R6_LISWE|nr:radical SAM protein [Listeria welshimeri]
MNNMKLRVCLTEKCNFKCEYCRPGGEGTETKEKLLHNDETIQIINKLVECGIEGVRFTGGEPLLRRGFADIVEKVSKIENVKKYTLVTNGSLINPRKAKQISELGFKSVAISLDSMSNNNFVKITGVNMLARVKNAISELKSCGVRVKINTVVTKSNETELDDIINFCIENKCDLKLLDLYDGEIGFWRDNYINMKTIIKKLESSAEDFSIQYQDEGFGTPENVFKIGGINIVVKDSNDGTCYVEGCKKCDLFPCQMGIVSLILTAEGRIKLCPLSNENNIDARGLINNRSSEVMNEVGKLFNYYNTAKFSKSWHS